MSLQERAAGVLQSALKRAGRDLMGSFGTKWRVAVRDTTIGGVPIEKGASVAMSQWILHRDPRYFEEPESFRPERWTEEMRDGLPKYAYFPFGVGPRGCIGEPLAKEIAVVTIATVASNWRLKVAQRRPVVPQARFSLMPKGGLRMQVVARKRA